MFKQIEYSGSFDPSVLSFFLLSMRTRGPELQFVRIAYER